MGVHGLWRLIEPSGKPVPLETLENKILAVDISIWLHQAIKGFQDSRGAPLPNAHLLGIYHRVCKLLYFRIKPVFVFDGGVPALKKQTIGKRNQQKAKNLNEVTNIQEKLIRTLLRHTAVNKVINEKSEKNGKEKEDMFKLPEQPAVNLDSTQDPDSSSSSDESSSSPVKQWDLHTIDEKSEHFRSLPADVRHEILTDLIETRKQSSWGRLHEMPKESGDFSSFQMKRLLKRFSVQTSLEEAIKEMGGHSLSLGELEALLNAEGIVTASETTTGNRIASNENTRYLLIKDVQKTMEKAKNEEEQKQKKDSKEVTEPESFSKDVPLEEIVPSKDTEFEQDLAAAIQLSLQDQPSTSTKTEFSFLENFNDGDFDSESESEEESLLTRLVHAKNFMTEYSGLTPSEIAKIINANGQKSKSAKKVTNKNGSNKKEKVSAVSNDKIDITEAETSKENLSTHQNTDKNILDKKEEVSATNDEEIQIIETETSKDYISALRNANIENAIADLTPKISQIIPDQRQNKKLVTDRTFKNASNLDRLNSGDVSEKNVSTFPNQSIQVDVNKKDLQSITEESMPSVSKSIENPVESSDSDGSDLVDVSENNIEKSVLEGVIKKDIPETSVDIINEKSVPVCNSKKKEENVEEMSDSNDSDFVEVMELKVETKPKLEIVVNLEESIKDDIFSDIFETEQPKNIDEAVNTEQAKSVDESTKLKISEHTEEAVSPEEKEISQVNPETGERVPEPEKPVLSVEDLNVIKADLAQEQKELMVERNTKERMAGNITDQMYQEAQELLELFGVPYIVAPMEAEAQCAFLNEIDLTDGTITDDSDIWLFGGKTVYKNFFNHNKHVLEFRAESIEHHFKLTREQLILLALLVGSDYTLGIQGIGPVTALEILAAFPASRKTNITLLTQNELISGLTDFRNWLRGGKALGAGRTVLRNKLRNVNVIEGFPNIQVIQAYLQPKVETSKERFTWDKPDIVGLIDFAREKFGWTRLKSEEILKPVMRKLQEKNMQKSIKDYFATKRKVEVDSAENKMSKRVKTAVKKIGKPGSESDDEKSKSKTKKGRKRAPRKPKNNDPSESTNNTSENVTTDNSTKDSGNTSKNISTSNIAKNSKTTSAGKDVSATKTLRNTRNKKPENVLLKEFIPQRERDKVDALRNKLKAIEVYRKSTQGPGFVPKRAKAARVLKEEAELSESSSSDE